MIKADSHVHTVFSPDSDSKIEDLIKEAENLGISHLTFTDHAEFSDTGVLCLDIEKYGKKFREIQATYEGSVNLYWGTEVGLRPDLTEKVKPIILEPGFDFVLGSIHRIDKIGVYNHELYEKGYSVSAIHRRYFEETLEAVNLYEGFHALGHLDFVARYGRNDHASGVDWDQHMDLIEAIFTTLISQDIALEINTAGYRYDLNATHPPKRILELYKQMGGEMITIGSDAHTVDNLGFFFDEVGLLLKEIGFKACCVFKKGKPFFVDI